jgi:hypothetical protein
MITEYILCAYNNRYTINYVENLMTSEHNVHAATALVLLSLTSWPIFTNFGMKINQKQTLEE